MLILKERKKFTLFQLIVATTLLMVFNILPVVAEPENELVFLTWPEYIDPEIVKKFEKQYQVKVRMVYFETDDMRDAMLLDSNGKGYDMVLIVGENIRIYNKRGWIAPLTQTQVPNLRFIGKKWLNAFEQTNGYAVPYFWGTLGIAYRKDLVEHEVTSWKELFIPEARLKNKILMIKTTDDVIGMALKALGYSANSTNPSEYQHVKEMLVKQKEYVKDFSYIKLTEDSALVKGDVYAAMVYNGDALALKELNPEIEFVLPREGGGLWVDYISVMASSNNKELAYKFINYINEPEHAAQIAEFVYFPTPHKQAEKLLPKEFLDDPVIYPDKQALQGSEFYKPLPPGIIKLRNSIFTTILQ
ncbi:MAG: spermidine/putrescine ABC transporter substrate-binding protein [Gammaproteobacteria bacterium]|nr:spermidine/putrescine ABC transporter substrate-binding protein [Gammaproteobacteria bacterium]